MTATNRPPIPHISRVTPSRHTAIVLSEPDNPTHVLHVWGPTRADRDDAIAAARVVITQPHAVKHHLALTTYTVLQSTHTAAPITRTAGDRWQTLIGWLALAAALAFIGGVIYYNMEVAS